MIEFHDIRRWDRLHLALHTGDDYECVVTGMTGSHVAEHGLWVAPVDPTDVNIWHGTRKVAMTDIKSITRVSMLSEAQEFFEAADIEAAVVTILSMKSVLDVIDPPDSKAFDALVDNVVTELRTGTVYTPAEIEAVTDHGLEKFWKAIVKGFPDIQSSNLPPEILVAFKAVAQSAVEMWVDVNS